jgi:Nif-specific regulatory protein
MKTSTAPVPAAPTLARAQANEEVAACALALLWSGNQSQDVAVLLNSALASILSAARGDYVALACFSGGRWTITGDLGVRTSLPVHWLSEVLDSESTDVQSSWVAAPLRPRAAGGELLVLHTTATPAPAASREAIDVLAPVLAQSLDAVRERQAERQRIERLRTVLEITSQWHETHEMEPLLVQMAQAATRLLRADRASIFLWDRPNHTLVGRPALGVAEGELRIPDNAGIVGQVVHLGEPRRVDLDRDQAQINRQVDASLGYKTRTLLCVPLRGRKGELFGAFEMINKLDGNFTDEDEAALVELAAHAAIALENTQERTRLLETRRQITEQAAQGVQMVGQSPAVEALRSTIRRVAGTELAVLVLGENGTGKEVVSQSIHYLSSRRDQPFIAVNCAALAETLLESELFGHEKGAFTDAHEARPGKFELASGGTLFLDEIGDLSLGGQAKLLRVLEEKLIVRVGGSKSIHTDARVIAATNQDLAEMVRQKKFRQDLYFRLNVVTLTIPPLRERPDDVWLLAEYFLNDFCRKARRKVPTFSAAARRKLETHSWPGNVRELRNLMERLAYLLPGDEVQPEDLAFISSPASESSAALAPDLPFADATDRFQIQYIQQALARAGGNMSRAAEQLGLHRSNLYRKMRQLGMTITE